ncbi:MAG: recombinase family protein [Candidatus Omnitrophica bacterium]|nr:recombinase family protein [Candidatus Omnitrophota bacterium]
MSEQHTCAIYCRYSSEQQRDSMSIEAQRRGCTEFAEKQGWKVHKIYVDEARSGTSDQRAAFQAMIAEATGKYLPFQMILVHKLDRFARNRYDSVKYKHILRRKGVRVVSATQPILGSGDPTEVLLEAMLEGMDEFYSLNLSRESLKGMAENARHGWWNGGFAPFGYRFVSVQTEKGPKRKLAVEESEARIVRRIFAMYVKGTGANAIRHRLNTEGVKYRGGYAFSRNLVLGILRNEKYCGDATFGKRLNKRQRPIDWKLEPITVKDAHEAIVDRKTWSRVQELLEGRQRTAKHPRAVASDYLFSGLMECVLCGASFVGYAAHGSGGRYRYYVCNTIVRKGAKACTQRTLNADDVERVFLEKLKARLTSEQALTDMVRGHNEALKEAQAQRGKQLPALEREILGIERKQRRLFEAIEDAETGLSRRDIAPRLRELAELKIQKELERDELKAQLAAKPIKLSKQTIKEWVEFFEALFADASALARKAFVQSLVVSVKIDDRYANLSYNPALTTERDRIDLRNPPDGCPGGGGGSGPPPGGGRRFGQIKNGSPGRTRT